ncbi:MAG: hypothetical protein ACR2GW_07770 [Pyrinomonadaceae bacterium]
MQFKERRWQMDGSGKSLEAVQELIISSVRELGQLRSDAAQAKSELDAMKKELEASERWQTHSTMQKEAKERASVVEAGLRKLTIEFFERTGDKTAHEAAKVRIVELLEYDEEQAKAWAIENLHEALNLDVDTFEEYAKGVRNIKPLPFVTFKKEPQPYISRNLSQYIAGESEV